MTIPDDPLAVVMIAEIRDLLRAAMKIALGRGPDGGPEHTLLAFTRNRLDELEQVVREMAPDAAGGRS